MTSKNQREILENQLEEILKIISSKGHDYAGQEDVLKVFRQVGELLEMDMAAVCQVFIATKILRLKNLSEAGKQPKHESIRDTLRDLQCYSLILEHIYLSQNQ
jgi:hypothetical protein